MSEASAKGQRAGRELTETDAAFQALRAGALEEIASTSPGQTEKREALYLFIHALEGARQALQRAVDNGLVADARAGRQVIAETTTLLRP